MQDNQHLTNNFHQTGKTKKPACKVLRVGTRKDLFLKIFKKILRFFDQNLYGKLTFFVNFHEISQIISASAPKVLPLEDNTRHQISTTIFSVSGGGGNVPPVPPPYATGDFSQKYKSKSKNRSNFYHLFVFYHKNLSTIMC